MWIGPSRQLTTRFPLSISPNSRYFVDRNGKPFLPLCDAAWELTVQCSQAQITQYLLDRYSRGVTAIIVEATTLLYSSQTPTYLNQASQSPFATITAQGSFPFGASACDFSSAAGQPYYQNLVFLVSMARSLGMVVILFPAYTGFPSSEQGWYDSIMGDTTAHLQAFGAFIATLLPKSIFGNIIWGAVGDNSLSASDLTHHWFIVQGITSVDPTALVYAKAQRNASGWTMLTSNGGLSSFPGLTVNNVYCNNSNGIYTQVSDTIAEYGRSPTMPIIVDETDYEGNGTATANDIRLVMWGPFLSGAYWVNFGNEQLWGYGCSNNLVANGPAATLASSLNTVGAQHLQVCAQILAGRQWWNLVPHTDTSLVTSSLGSGASTISPTLSSDGTTSLTYFAAGGSATFNLAALSVASFNGYWVDPTTGASTLASGSPFSNTGTHVFTTPGNNAYGDPDWLLELR